MIKLWEHKRNDKVTRRLSGWVENYKQYTLNKISLVKKLCFNRMNFKVNKKSNRNAS